jgi:PHD/YefM family antitoxin component YafN of YafNO toxin-antitoxin module
MNLQEKYLTDVDGNRVGVVLSLEEYRMLLDSLEELDAIRAFDEALAAEDEAIPLEVAIAEIEQNR